MAWVFEDECIRELREMIPWCILYSIFLDYLQVNVASSAETLVPANTRKSTSSALVATTDGT
jgi:hypothetical protein